MILTPFEETLARYHQARANAHKALRSRWDHVTGGRQGVTAQAHAHYDGDDDAKAFVHSPTRVTYISAAPTPSDFVCDVELTAKRVLTPEQFTFLRVYHFEGLRSRYEGDLFYKWMDSLIQSTVAAEWIHRRLYPSWLYFLNHPFTLVTDGQWLLDNPLLDLAPQRRGRPRKYPTRAARQAAYRERQAS